LFKSLDSVTLDSLNSLLQINSTDEEQAEWTTWHSLKAEPGKAGLESMKEAASRLNLLREVGVPPDLFKSLTLKLLERYTKRAAVEESFGLRRHAEPLRATLMAAFLFRRGEDLTDHLVDLLVETVHKMGKTAERRIEAGLGQHKDSCGNGQQGSFAHLPYVGKPVVGGFRLELVYDSVCAQE